MLLSSDAVLVCIHLLEFSNNFLPMTYYDFVVVFNKQADKQKKWSQLIPPVSHIGPVAAYLEFAFMGLRF